MLWKEVAPGFSFVSCWGTYVSIWLLLSVHEYDDEYLELVWLVTRDGDTQFDRDYRMHNVPVWPMGGAQRLSEVVGKGRKHRIA